MTTRVIHKTDEAIPAAQASTGERVKTARRLVYIDNLRTFLTALVLLHHIMIIYAGSGDWIYNEGRQDLVTQVAGSIFCAVNQAYFMGLFMLISGYFVPGAFDRKGAGRFWKDRLLRLGIPLVVYSWLVNPVFVYWYLAATQGARLPWWDFYTGQYFRMGYWIGSGPLWFVEALLIFTLVYSMWRWISRSRPVRQPAQITFPSNRALALFGLLMGLASFLVRLAFPVDWNFKPLNLQLPFFAQYIAMFAAGLLAYRQGWLEKLPDSAGRRWLLMTGFVLLMYVPGALLGGALESDLPYKGGWHWQSLYSSMWEAYLCLGMSISVLYLFQRYASRSGGLAGWFARSAYAAYIIQAPVITAVALLLRELPYHPLLKFAIVSAIAVPLCFGAGDLLRRLPYADKVL